MGQLLAVSSLVIGVGVAILIPEHGPAAVLLCAVATAVAAYTINGVKWARHSLLQIFIAALLVRIVLGTLIFILNLQDFFGGDAITYDNFGYEVLRTWQGEYSGLLESNPVMLSHFWGMPYYVAAIYSVTGRNLLAVQFMNSVIGAATVAPIYLCTQQLFNNRWISRLSALFVAFFPSLVLWSCQGLKDGPIVFLLAVAMLATLRLGERLSLKYSLVLMGALLGLFSLRFYIFYITAAAVGGALVIGMRQTTKQNLVRQFVLVIVFGLAMTYLGVSRAANTQYETYGNLEAVQRSRLDQATTASSGFGRDADVSTTKGALLTIPLGMIHLLFAPFPWQVASLRQSITLPEMLIWWASIPLLVLGLWFTVRYRLRQALPILLFTSMLTLVYSLFQGNVGTAYRQRAQLLVFYFIFISVGCGLLKERREDRLARSGYQK